MLCVLVGVASAALGLFAFTRPELRTVYDETQYRHTGRFSYSAPAPPGLYDGNVLRTGEPVFRRLVSRVNVGFDYRLQAEEAQDLGGVSRLTATLTSSNGWRSSFDLQGESAFRGPSVQLRGVLDLSKIQALLDRLEGETGVTAQQYTLAIVPTIAISGTLAGRPLADRFAPQLAFSLDELQMQLAPSGRAGQGADPLVPSESRSLQQSRTAPNVISLLGLSLEAPVARRLALIGLFLSLLAASGLLLAWKRRTPGGEEARIRDRYGSLLVEVRNPAPIAGRCVEVASIDDLARVAERNNRMILCQHRDGEWFYCVPEDTLSYCYRSPAVSRAAVAAASALTAGEGGR
jgi:hypothetical protein